MDDFPITPPIIVKDTPKPRRLTKVAEARDYVGEAMRLGRPAPWREVWHRLKTVASEDEAIEAIGDLRELLVEEDLLLPDGETRWRGKFAERSCQAVAMKARGQDTHARLPTRA